MSGEKDTAHIYAINTDYLRGTKVAATALSRRRSIPAGAANALGAEDCAVTLEVVSKSFAYSLFIQSAREFHKTHKPPSA